MFDKTLVRAILTQIYEALEKIASRAEPIRNAKDFTSSMTGMEKLDSICMLFMAIGEALKNIDKITHGALLSKYPGSIGKGSSVLET